MSKTLLQNIKAKTAEERKDGLNASAALMHNLRERADRGEVKYVALYSSDLSTTGSLKKSTKAAIGSVKTPKTGQYEIRDGVQSVTSIRPGTRMLMAVAWAETKSLERGARYPEVASVDCTYKTNDEHRPFFKIQGVDGEGQTFCRLNVLLWDESLEAFNFVFSKAMPMIWGPAVCDATSVFLSDGDPHEIRALDLCIKNGICKNATRKRCYWHLVHQAFSKLFGNGALHAAENATIRRYFHSLAYTCETDAELKETYSDLLAWINVNTDTSFLTRKTNGLQRTRRETMHLFVRTVVAQAGDWARCKRMGLCDMGHITSALSEAANAMLKRGKLGVNPRMHLNETVETTRKQEMQNNSQIAATSDRRLNSRPLPNKKQAPSVIAVGSSLTTLATAKLDIQYGLHKKYRVARVARDAWKLYPQDPHSEDDDADDNSDADDECVVPKFRHCRDVTLRNGCLYCSCKYFESMLLSCRHIIAVKRGTLCKEDCHFRWWQCWQAGVVPLSSVTRTFEDLSCGPTSFGVDFTQQIGQCTSACDIFFRQSCDTQMQLSKTTMNSLAKKNKSKCMVARSVHVLANADVSPRLSGL